MKFEADYFDGISPRAKRVLVTISDSHFSFIITSEQSSNATDQAIEHLITDCHIQARLGSGKRLIDLPDGSRLETDFQHLEQHLPHKMSNTFWRMVHFTEGHKLFILLAFIGIALSSLALVKYGVPVAAKYAAMATPPEIERDLGKQTLDALDNEKLGYFAASELTVSRQKSIADALTKLCSKTGNCPQYQLHFRKSPQIGANAFALPGGSVIMTDELVELAKNEDEVIAVLAHELGHVKERHALRQTLQGTISGLILIAITGDFSAIAAGLPTLMLNMNYSRDLELDADAYALESLKTACIPSKSFATILLRLEKSHGDVSVPEMISSHPDTKARVLPFLKNHSQCT